MISSLLLYFCSLFYVFSPNKNYTQGDYVTIKQLKMPVCINNENRLTDSHYKKAILIQIVALFDTNFMDKILPHYDTTENYLLVHLTDLYALLRNMKKENVFFNYKSKLIDTHINNIIKYAIDKDDIFASIFRHCLTTKNAQPRVFFKNFCYDVETLKNKRVTYFAEECLFVCISPIKLLKLSEPFNVFLENESTPQFFYVCISFRVIFHHELILLSEKIHFLFSKYEIVSFFVSGSYFLLSKKRNTYSTFYYESKNIKIENLIEGSKRQYFSVNCGVVLKRKKPCFD